MRIGLDARAAFLDPRRGFGRVTRALAEALLGLLPGRLVVFVPHGARVPSRWYDAAAEVVQLRRPRRAAFLVDPLAWRVALARHPVEILHLPTWGVPRGLPVPVVATFYDAIPIRFPSPPGRWSRTRARWSIRSLARAAAVHAISSHAARELLAHVALPGDRVHPVPLGVGPPFRPATTSGAPGHVLYVGGGDPHKNLEVILRAYALTGAEALPPLLLAGAAASDAGVLGFAAAEGLTGRLIAVSGPSDEQLAGLYRTALATVLPSPFEGFGLPALEAMACACPVLAADAGALPEVCGDAAVLLPHDRPEAWRDALLEVASQPAVRSRQAEAGLRRAAAFGWERTARGVAAIYQSLSSSPSARI